MTINFDLFSFWAGILTRYEKINMDFMGGRLWKCEVGETGSGSYPMVHFGISCIKPLASVTKVLLSRYS
jgi:hypothetical protein